MTYLFIYNSSLGSEEDVIALLNDYDGICSWRTDIPGTFFLQSDKTAESIAEYIINTKPNSRFFVVEISHNRQGWLPKNAWSFIKGTDK